MGSGTIDQLLQDRPSMRQHPLERSVVPMLCSHHDRGSEASGSGREDSRLTWEETKTCNGPTIAKKPIYTGVSPDEGTSHLEGEVRVSLTVTHFVHVDNLTIDDFAFERLHHHCQERCLESCLSGRREDLSLADRGDSNDRDDVAEERRRRLSDGIPSQRAGKKGLGEVRNPPIFPTTCPLDILVQFLTKVILELRAKIRWVEENGVRELALWR